MDAPDPSFTPVRPGPFNSDENSICDMSEVVDQLDQVIKLLKDQRSTATYIHQFGVWLLGIGVILAFYFNYVLLQPILWTLFAVLFSYVALYVPKVKVVKFLVWLLGPHEKSMMVSADPAVDSPRDIESASWFSLLLVSLGNYFRMVIRLATFVLLPSAGVAASSMYFSVLYRLMFFHFYQKTVLLYFPETNVFVLKSFFTVSVSAVTVLFLDSLRRSVMSKKRRRMEKRKSGGGGSSALPNRSWTVTIFDTQDWIWGFVEKLRIFFARLILPHSHLIAAIVVILGTLVILTTFGVWFAYAFRDELIYIYQNIAKVVRMANTYLNKFTVYTHYVDKAYNAVSAWITSVVLADSASAKTKALYEYMSYMSFHKELLTGQSELSETILRDCSVTPSALVSSFSDLCALDAVKTGTAIHISNATIAIVSAVQQDLESLIKNPYAVVNGFWELVDYYQDELATGGTISKGGDYLLWILNYLKEFILHSGSISLTAIGSGVSVFTFLFDSVLQALVFMTALFLLLQSQLGFYHYTAVLLHFIDPSTMLYRAIHRALRAILLSSIKMAVFHAGLTWLLFSFFCFPLVCIPTLVAFLLGLVPIVSPVIVTAIPLPIWAYANYDSAGWAVVVLAVCFHVWWFVGTSIYAEIPDSSVWMTTFSVGLGISLFGARGVIIGPMIATIPFALYGLGSSYISQGSSVNTRFSNGVLTPLRQMSKKPPHSAKRQRNEALLTRLATNPVRRMSSTDTAAVARRVRLSSGGATNEMDHLIEGAPGRAEDNRAKLFEYIMTTPKNVDPENKPMMPAGDKKK